MKEHLVQFYVTGTHITLLPGLHKRQLQLSVVEIIFWSISKMQFKFLSLDFKVK